MVRRELALGKVTDSGSNGGYGRGRRDKGGEGRPKDPSRVLDVLMNHLHLGKLDERSQICRRAGCAASGGPCLLLSRCFETKAPGRGRTPICESWGETE